MKSRLNFFALMLLVLTSCQGTTSQNQYQHALTLESIETLEERQLRYEGRTGMPSSGDVRVLVVPLEIADNPFPLNYKSTLDSAFNGEPTTIGWESVASFYQKSSYGNLRLTFDITDKYTLPNSRAYYEEFEGVGDYYALSEIIPLINEDDLHIYDSNQDQVIDSIIFIYSVPSDYDTFPWWGWANTFDNLPYLTPDDWDLDLGYYIWASYDFLFSRSLGANVLYDPTTYIHEIGHLFGLPDLYPYSGGVGPLGGWDMMDLNAGDHGPFNKMLLGWLKPLYLDQVANYEVTLDSYALTDDGTNSALIIPSPTADLLDGDIYDEFLLIMYYTPDGLYEQTLAFEPSLTERGIVIYHVNAHVNYGASSWEMFGFDNNQGSPFLISIVEVDLNSSIPSPSNRIRNQDILLEGSFDCSSYFWHSGERMNVEISIEELTSTQADVLIYMDL